MLERNEYVKHFMDATLKNRYCHELQTTFKKQFSDYNCHELQNLKKKLNPLLLYIVK